MLYSSIHIVTRYMHIQSERFTLNVTSQFIVSENKSFFIITDLYSQTFYGSVNRSMLFIRILFFIVSFSACKSELLVAEKQCVERGDKNNFSTSAA